MTYPFNLEPIAGGRFVVRDDLVPGGTKRRALDHLLTRHLSDEREFVYASPVYGYAQIALAHAAAAAGKRSTIFVAKRNIPHPRTLEAKAAGATVMQVPHGYLTHVQAKARAYCRARGAFLLPFGLDFPAFINILTAEIREGVGSERPSQVWVAAGSGTLSRVLQDVFPSAEHFAIQVGKGIKPGRAHILIAPEDFQVDGKQPPPFPSCSNYDAKVWQFFHERAAPGAWYWNVAS